jgi:hypothetical protein
MSDVTVHQATPRNANDIQSILDECYEKLRVIDNITPASDDVNLLWRWSRVALSALDGAKNVAGIPEKDRDLWRLCVTKSLETLLNEAGQMT